MNQILGRRREVLAMKATPQYPEQEIGYNLLIDVQNFEMINIENPEDTKAANKRWAATADYIPINPNYTYRVGKVNTKYSAFCYDGQNNYLGAKSTSFYGGVVTPFVEGTIKVRIGWGRTGATVEQFEASINEAGQYDHSTGSFFYRET